MKKLLLVTAVIAGAIGVMAQGTINFNNRVLGAGLDQPISYNGARLDGATYLAQLYVGAVEGSLVPVGTAVTFRTGAGAGYVNIANANVSVPHVAPGALAFAQVRAWEASGGDSYELASTKVASGMSAVFQIEKLGGLGSPPSLPADMVNFKSFSLTAIPEPSTVALGLLGAVSLLAFRRK